jgi:hypothetical protein
MRALRRGGMADTRVRGCGALREGRAMDALLSWR